MENQPTKTSENCAQWHFAEPCSESQIDDLSLLGNRRFLESTLADWKADSNAPPIAMIMLDLDRFKQVNDTLGHEVGDKLLKLVAERIKKTASVQDAIYRLGGDEFIILNMLHGNPADASGITYVAKSLVEVLSRPFLVSGQQINIGASVGISILNQGTEKVEDLMRHADLALYDAKDAGRGTFRIFTAELEQKTLDRRAIEINLRRALGLKEFNLLYQPQVDLPDGNVVGFEALLRWNNHERGLVLPNDFIPLAEELGEIHAIGEWVMQTACSDATQWPEHLHVAVNVSPVQFENTRFVDTVRNALNRSGLPAERLELEITESVLIHKPKMAFEHLSAIREMGVGIAMDDFGTGYSSLSYLNEFPFSKIKIDQAFIHGKNAKKSKALVEAIISLGSNLGMKTLAEGVETPAQYSELADGGCLGAQGYLISKPMAVDAIDEFMTRYIQDSGKKAA
jgi:diguanylate cyclase (GGDEF)-like protein